MVVAVNKFKLTYDSSCVALLSARQAGKISQEEADEQSIPLTLDSTRINLGSIRPPLVLTRRAESGLVMLHSLASRAQDSALG